MTTTTPYLAGARQYGNYLTLEDARAWLRFPYPEAPSDHDAQLQRVIDMACTKVQQRIDRAVGSQTFWERHDGWSGEFIMLKETPILELVSCTEWRSSGGSVTLTESTPENPIDGVQINYATGRIMRTFAGYSWPRPFFPGSRNIEFTYKAGLNPVPPDLWMATVEWVADWWRNTQQQSALRPPGMTMNNEFDPADDKTFWRGMPHWVEDMCADYRKVSVA